MKTISLHVPEEAYDAFKAAAARQNRPIAELVREAMIAWLAVEQRSVRSIADIVPHDSGEMLEAWSRSDLLDEMMER